MINRFRSALAAALVAGLLLVTPAVASAALFSPVDTVKAAAEVVGLPPKPIPDPGVQLFIDGQPPQLATAVYFDGYTSMAPVGALAGSLGATVTTSGDRIVVTKGSQTIGFKLGVASATVDGKAVPLDAAPVVVDKHTLVPLRFLAQNLSTTVVWQPFTRSVHLRTEKPANPVAGRRIYLDPGHGGYDPGTYRGSLYEKNLVLTVTNELNLLLKQAGAIVAQSRTTDEFVGLYDRAGEANSWRAEAFVSVHVNSAGSTSAQGTETWYWRTDNDSGVLAGALQRNLLASLGRLNRGVQRNDFVVVRETGMPASLVELAFLSNPQEAQLLADPSFLSRAAKAIFDGLVEYFTGRP